MTARRIDSADSLWEMVCALTPQSATEGLAPAEFRRSGSHINRTIFAALWSEGTYPRVPYDIMLRLVEEQWSCKVNMATDQALKAIARLKKHVARLNEHIEASEWTRAAFIADRGGSFQLVVDETAVLERLEDRRRAAPRGAPKPVVVILDTERTDRGLAMLRPGDPIQFEVTSTVDGYLHVFHEDLLGQVDNLFALNRAKKRYVHRQTVVKLPEDVLLKGYGWRVLRLKRSGERDHQRLIVIITPLDVAVGERELRLLDLIGPQHRRGIAAIRPVFGALSRGTLGIGQAAYRYSDN